MLLKLGIRPRWESTTLRTLGMLEAVFALLLLIPAAVALFLGEKYTVFLEPVPILLILGVLQMLLFKTSSKFRSVNGLLLIGLVWLVMFLISLVPYMLSGLDFVDSLFEAVSGITTTGLSVMVDVESQPISILIWRSLTMWVGGIMIIIVFLYLLPLFGVGRSAFTNELSGSGSSYYSMKMRNAAKSFIFSYAILSFINLVLLLVFGMSPVEAFCLMCTTISTGGLMCTNDSMMSYSDPIQWITILFMFLGATNFYLHYRAIHRRERGVYRKNSEFRTMLWWFLGISVIIYLLVLSSGESDINGLEGHYEAFKNALFTTVSLGTTTGLYVNDFTLYPEQCIFLLMIVALIGGCSGSTSGGIKFSRIRIIYEYLRNNFGKMVHPNGVYDVKMDGSSVDNESIQSALTVFLIFIVSIIVGTILILIVGISQATVNGEEIGIIDSLGLAISTISNGGMGFGSFGPTGNFAGLQDSLKLILIVMMWIGRLEVVTALVLFTPGFWKDLIMNRSHRGYIRTRMARRARSRQ